MIWVGQKRQKLRGGGGGALHCLVHYVLGVIRSSPKIKICIINILVQFQEKQFQLVRLGHT